MALPQDIDRLAAVENAIDDALDQPRSHTVTGSYVYESWSLRDLEHERSVLVRRIARKCGLTNTVSSGGH